MLFETCFARSSIFLQLSLQGQVEKTFVNATTSSLAFEMLEGEEQALKVMKRVTLEPTFPFRLKAALSVEEDVFLANDTMSTDEVICIKGKMTVSFPWLSQRSGFTCFTTAHCFNHDRNKQPVPLDWFQETANRQMQILTTIQPEATLHSFVEKVSTHNSHRLIVWLVLPLVR